MSVLGLVLCAVSLWAMLVLFFTFASTRRDKKRKRMTEEELLHDTKLTLVAAGIMSALPVAFLVGIALMLFPWS